MVDNSPGNEGRYNDSRYTNAKLLKIKVIVVVFWISNRIAGSHGLGRTNMIIKSAMFVVGDNENAVCPVGRVADSLINSFQEFLTTRDIILWMLRISAGKSRRGMPIVWL